MTVDHVVTRHNRLVTYREPHLTDDDDAAATDQDDLTARAALSRRRVLGLTVSAGAATVLVACGGSDTETADAGAGSSPSGESAASDADSQSPAGGDEVLANTADVPVGSGVILEDAKVVVTQPTEGEFKGFSAVCTHKGCTVGSIKENTINCPCHGSSFKISDGSVVTGPATRPLDKINVKVDGGSIVKA